MGSRSCLLCGTPSAPRMSRAWGSARGRKNHASPASLLKMIEIVPQKNVSDVVVGCNHVSMPLITLRQKSALVSC